MRLLIPGQDRAKVPQMWAGGPLTTIGGVTIGLRSNLPAFLGLLHAGGPGSGCHGPNCGRPKLNTGTMLKQHGWKLSNKTAVLGTKIAKVYTHKQHGELHVTLSHFHHKTAEGSTIKLHKGVVGSPLSQQLKEYLKEHEAKQAAAPTHPLPPGMPKEIVHKDTGEWLEWNHKTGEYSDSYGNKLSVEQAKAHLDKPYSAPQETPILTDKPPNGMAEVYKNEIGTQLHYDPTTGKYQSILSDGNKGLQLSPSNVLKNGWQEQPGGKSVLMKQEAPEEEAIQKPPAGMAEVYENAVGSQYHYDPTDGTYQKVLPSGELGRKYTPEDIKNTLWLDKPGSKSMFMPKEEGAPKLKDGMSQVYTTGIPGKEYHYDPSAGNYKIVKDGIGVGTVAKADVAEYAKSGTSHASDKPSQYYPEAGPTPPKEKADAQPPAGMAKVYVVPGADYVQIAWDSKSASYISQHGPMYSAEELQQILGNPATKLTALPESVHNEKTGHTYSYNQADHTYTSSSGKIIPVDFVVKQLDKGTIKPVPDTKVGAPQKPVVPSPSGTAPTWLPKGSTVTDPAPPSKPRTKSPDVELPKSGAPPVTTAYTFEGPASHLGGGHEKYFYKDAGGQQWLFKPSTTQGGSPAPLIAKAEEAASKIAQLVRPEGAVAVKAVTVDLPGHQPTFGSMQKMIDPNSIRANKDFAANAQFPARDPGDLKPWEIQHLQNEQVVDWLISNHDSHAGQFIRTKDRGLYGIDKAQAFKYFGKDELSTSYHPNATYGEKPPFYNQMWGAVKEGKISFDPNAIHDAIKRVEDISDVDYKKILAPYAAERFNNSKDANAFLDKAVGRKNSLRSDFEKFYSGVLGKKFEFEKAAVAGGEATIYVPGGHKPESQPDNEYVPPVHKIVQADLPALLKNYPIGSKQSELNLSAVEKWDTRSAGAKTKADYEKAAAGLGVYPELAAKAGLKPSDLSLLHESIGNWKSTTHSTGAAYIRGAAQQVLDPEGCCKSRFAAALQLEYEITQHKLAQLYPEGNLQLYRGLSGTVAQKFKEAKSSALFVYHTMGAEGYSSNTSTSGSFSDGVVIKLKVPLQNIISSYITNISAHSSHQGEQESFVAFKGKQVKLKRTEVDIKGAKAARPEEIHVDGTTQSHLAFPPEWRTDGTGVPVPVIEFEVVNAEPKKRKK